MILDAREIADGSVLTADVVIVGSGPAGISLALELAAQGMQIVILEAGGERYSRREQRHFEGEVVDPTIQPALHQYRTRQLGGGSNVWGGRCCPYDDIDFEKRAWVPFSGWPIGHQHLEKYYARAQEYLDIGEFCYDAAECLDREMAAPFPGMIWERISDARIWRWSLPTNFRTKYRKHLAGLANVRLLTHASCLELRPGEDAGRIAEALFDNGRGCRIRARARMFALAAGALETARLLLVSREGHAHGLGNGYDQVGRYFQTHLYGSVAKLRFLGDPSRVGYHFKRSRDGVYVQHMLATRAEVQRDRRLMNFCTVLHYPFLDDPSHGSAILSSVFLAKGLLAHRLPAELFGRALDQKHGSQGSRRFPARMIGRHLRNVATDAGAVPAFAWDWLTRRMLVRRKLPGVKVYSRRGEYDLLYSAEQEPNPDSRVMLSGVPDAFGYSRLRSDWRYTDRDVASIVENHEIIAEDVRGSNNPCVAMDIDRTSLAERIRAGTRLGSHHIGTTRMSQNPRTGVVDEQCRVHGTANLFIAGSGVFPTSSCMSVTLLIVAIAARVADTIAGEFRRQ